MKLACLFIHPFSESPGSSVRVEKLLTSMGKQGAECLILNPYEKNRELGKNVSILPLSNYVLPERFRSLLYFFSRRVYYSKLYMGNPLLLIKSQEFLGKRLAHNLESRLKNTNIRILQVEQDLTIPTGLEFKKLTSLPVVADIHNFVHLELVSAGIIKERSESYQRISHWMGTLLNQLDLIIAVSDYMKQYMMAEYSISEDKIIVIPPGASPDMHGISNQKDKTKVVYAGLVAYRENLELYIRSIPYVLAKKPEAEFYIGKKGEDYPRLMSLANILNVRLTPFWFEDIREYHSFMQSCKVAILPSSNDMARKVGTPLKLFDYLSFGLPVVANDVGAWSEIIKKEKVGVVTENTPESFAEGILKLINDPKLAIECGCRGKELVKKQYNWDNNAKILLDAYGNLLNKKYYYNN